MAELFDRDFVLQVGPREIRARQEPTLQPDAFGNLVQTEGENRDTLRVTFGVKKTLGKNTNEAEVAIYNLNRDSRQAIGQTRRPAVVIEAGYAGNVSQLFKGNLIFGENRREGTNWITELQGGDGQKSIATARINQSFAPGTSVEVVANALASAFDGIDPGNLVERIQQGGLRKGLTEFVSGKVVSGRVTDELNKLVASIGGQLSIQDEQLQLLFPDETTNETAFVISPRTGLIGSPETGDDSTVTVKTLLLPQVKPGRRIKVESASIDGFYRVESISHSGDTWGGDWTSTIEGKIVE